MKYLSLNLVCFLSCLILSTHILAGNGSDINQTEKSGFVFDLRVANMPYKSDRIEGRTSRHGEFIFIEGENITFSLGNYHFNPVKADQYLSVFKLIKEGDLAQSVSNLTRLLQAIDTEPEKITIVIPNLPSIDLSRLNFNQSTHDFSSDPIIINLLNSLGLNTNLMANIDTDNHVYSMVSMVQGSH